MSSGPPMRIAMFLPGLDPSSLGWQVHRDFARAIAAEGHSFSILSTAPAGSPRSGADDRSSGGGHDRSAVDEEPVVFTVLQEPRLLRLTARLAAPWLRTRSLIPAAAALGRHLRQHGDAIDLLHVEIAYPHGAAAALAVAWTGWEGLLAITPMGEDFLVVEDAAYGFRRYRIPDLLVRRALRRCDAIRCISPMVEEFVAPVSPAAERAVVPLNVGATYPELAREPEERRSSRRRAARRRLRGEFDLAGDRPIVLALGRLHPFKGIDLLVEAMVHLPDAQLLIVGPSLTIHGFGDTGERLRRQAERLGVGDRLRLPGSVPPDRVPEILSGVDVVAVPSRRESLNKVCVEASAVGTPFVVTSTTGISSFVPDEPVGVVVPPRNPEALARAVERILDPGWRFDPEAARRFVERFAPQRIAGEVLELYRRAAETR